MRHPDELNLHEALLRAPSTIPTTTTKRVSWTTERAVDANPIASALNIPPKRLAYILHKWERGGVWLPLPDHDGVGNVQGDLPTG